jgi:hypothetical protein
MTSPASPDGNTQRLDHAETALQCCTNRRETMAAVREYFAAKAKAAAEADR